MMKWRNELPCGPATQDSRRNHEFESRRERHFPPEAGFVNPIASSVRPMP